MPAHGFSPAAITAFGQPEVEFYYLVRMDFSTPVYFSLAPFDISHGGNTYNSDGLVLSVPDIVETLKIKPSTVTIAMSGASTFVHGLTVSELYRNADVFIYIHEVSTGETKQVFKGFLDSFDSDNDDQRGQSTVRWKVANHWTNWQAKAGRFISHANQQELYPGDLGLEFASQARKPVGEKEASLWGVVRSKRSFAFDLQLFNYRVFRGAANGQNKSDDSLDQPVQPEFKEKLPLVYGTRNINGFRILADFSYIDLAGGNLKYEYYWEVFVLAEGECDSLLDVTFDGESYLGAKLSPYVEITFHGGTPTQAADAGLVASDLAYDNWTASHQLKNICHCVIRYTHNDDVWGTTSPTDPLFTLKAKKVFDQRNSQTAYSSNNVLVLRDFLTNALYGKGIDGSLLKKFNEGADYCATLKTDNTGPTPKQIPLFDFNGFIDTGNSIKDNAEDIMFSMRAHLPYINGEYVLVIERDDEVGTFEIDEDNIEGKFQVIDGRIQSLANEITYDFIELDDNGNEVDEQVIVKSASLLAEDKGRILRKSFTNKNENNRYRAENRGATLLKRSREQIRTKTPVYSMSAIEVEAGEIVNLSSALRGWISKPHRAEVFRLSEKGVYFELREYEKSVNDWEVKAESGTTSNSNLPSVFETEPVTNLVLLSNDLTLLSQLDGTIVPRIKVNFDSPDDVFNLSGYYVYIRPAIDPIENDVLIETINNINTTETFIANLQEGINYTVSVAAFNRFTSSDKVFDSEIALGKSAPPQPATNLIEGSVEAGVVNLAWDASPSIDISHYKILTSLSNNIASASIAGTQQDVFFNHATENDRYYWVVAVDTSGNDSTVEPDTTQGVLGEPDGLTAVADWETLTGRPYDSLIFNSLIYRNGFEDEIADWVIHASDTLVQDSDNQSGGFSGLFTSGLTGPSPGAGSTRTYVRVPLPVGLSFYGKRVRVSFYHKNPPTNASPKFAISVTTNGDGNSGWHEFTTDTSGSFITDSFLYDVFPLSSGSGEFDIAVWADSDVDGLGDGGGLGRGVMIDNIIIDVIANTVDLAGDFKDIDGTDNIVQTFYLSTEPTIGVGPNFADEGDYWYNASNNLLHQLINFPPLLWIAIQDDDIVNAIASAATAQTTADGKIKTYFQPSPPVASDIGDIWFDTSDGNKQYRSESIGADVIAPGEWVLVQDTGIGTALSDATDALNAATSAQAVADGKITTFFRFEPPPVGDFGDLWINKSDDSRMYRAEINGADQIIAGEWVLVQDEQIGQAIVSATSAQATADGKITTFLRFEPPPVGDFGDLWINKSDDSRMYRAEINGADQIIAGEWVLVQDEQIGQAITAASIAQATADGKVNTFYRFNPPPVGDIGDLWINRDDENKMYRANSNGSDEIASGEWVLVQDQQIADAFATATQAANDVDGKVTTFIGTNPPTAEGVGDLWMDTNDENRLYRAASVGADAIGVGEWELLDQGYADWSRIFNNDGKKPANNADVSTPTKCLVKQNFSTFNSGNGGYGYVTGIGSNGLIADVTPIVYYNGFAVPIDKSNIRPNVGCEGYIIYYPTAQGSFGDGRSYAVGVPTVAGSAFDWDVYYNGQVNRINVNAGHIVIGTARFNSATSFNSSVVWGYAISTAEISAYQADITNYEDIRVSNHNTDNSVLTILNPIGGRFNSTTTDASGALVITLPGQFSWNTSLKFMIDINVRSGASFQVGVAGDLDSSSGEWKNVFAQIYGNLAANNQVRFSQNASGKPVVIVGQGGGLNTWDRPQIVVRDFQAGVSNFSYSQWDDNWGVHLDGSLTGYQHHAILLDALLDAKSILGQGALATDDTVNYLTVDPETATRPRSVSLASKVLLANVSYHQSIVSTNFFQTLSDAEVFVTLSFLCDKSISLIISDYGNATLWENTIARPMNVNNEANFPITIAFQAPVSVNDFIAIKVFAMTWPMSASTQTMRNIELSVTSLQR